MNILHLSTYSRRGGAALAAGSFHMACRRANISSWLLVASFIDSDEPCSIHDPSITPFRNRFYQRLRLHLETILLKPLTLFSRQAVSACILPSRSSYLVNESTYDLVHIHWFNASFITIEDILRFKKKFILHCHDLWLLHCPFHIQHKTSRYNLILRFIVSLNRVRISRLLNASVSIIVPSRHMFTALTDKYPQLAKKVFIIPNIVQAEYYNTCENKSLPYLDRNLRLCLCSASSVYDPNKNIPQIAPVLSILLEKGYSIELHCIGIDVSPLLKYSTPMLKVNVHPFGMKASTIRSIYTNSHMSLSLSRFESFGLTIAESLVSNTPVCAFDVDGPNELIDHKVTGYLAKPFCCDSFAAGIEYIFSNRLSLNRFILPASLDPNLTENKLMNIYSSICQ